MSNTESFCVSLVLLDLLMSTPKVALYSVPTVVTSTLPSLRQVQLPISGMKVPSVSRRSTPCSDTNMPFHQCQA
jgi:hypothetical protein